MEAKVCKCLIGMHTSTGCDTVSASVGRGKITALRLGKQHTSYQEMFKQLGVEWVRSDIFFRASKRLHVKSIALNQELITSMSCGTGYSAPRRVTSTPPSYHLVLTACSSVRFAQTSKRPFGSEVCKTAKGHRPPLALAGAKTAITLPGTG